MYGKTTKFAWWYRTSEPENLLESGQFLSKTPGMCSASIYRPIQDYESTFGAIRPFAVRKWPILTYTAGRNRCSTPFLPPENLWHEEVAWKFTLSLNFASPWSADSSGSIRLWSAHRTMAEIHNCDSKVEYCAVHPQIVTRVVKRETCIMFMRLAFE